MTHTQPMDRESIRERYERIVALSIKGYRVSEIVRIMDGISVRMVHRARRRYKVVTASTPRQLTLEEIQIADDMLDNGASIAEVARTLGHPPRSLNGRFRGRSEWTPSKAQYHRRMVEKLEAL